MKMGNTRSLWRYDGLFEPAMSHAGAAVARRKSSDHDPHQAAARFVVRRACLGGGIRRSAGTRKLARNRCTIATPNSFAERVPRCLENELNRQSIPNIHFLFSAIPNEVRSRPRTAVHQFGRRFSSQQVGKIIV
jgi:hypothetical protein